MDDPHTDHAQSIKKRFCALVFDANAHGILMIRKRPDEDNRTPETLWQLPQHDVCKNHGLNESLRRKLVKSANLKFEPDGISQLFQVEKTVVQPPASFIVNTHVMLARVLDASALRADRKRLVAAKWFSNDKARELIAQIPDPSISEPVLDYLLRGRTESRRYRQTATSVYSVD